LRDRVDVLLRVQHVRVYSIRHPAQQRKTTRCDRFCGQQRLADTTQAHANDQHHRQTQILCEVSGVVLVIQRHTKTTHALDHHRLRLRTHLLMAIDQVLAVNQPVF
jgi:hypothetical protein